MKTYLKSFVSFAALALIMCFAAAQSANAVPVTYNTSGTFTSGAGTTGVGNTLIIGTGPGAVTLTYTPAVAAMADPQGGSTFANFGVITAAGGSMVPGAGVTGTATFTLTINQIAPTTGATNFVGTLTGTIDFNTSNIVLRFTPGDVGTLSPGMMIGNYTYFLRNLQINPAGTNGGITSVDGVITETSAVPEPATMLLLGSGLAGLAGVARRRRLKTDAE